MSANFQSKSFRSVSSSQESISSNLLSSYKNTEFHEMQALLEKGMFFLDKEERKVLRKELRNSNPSLEFLLLKGKNKGNHGIEKEIKKFLLNFKKKPMILKENKENMLKEVPKQEKIMRKTRNVFITLTDLETNNNQDFFQAKIEQSPQLKQFTSEISTKMSDFSQFFSVYETPKMKLNNISQFKEKIKAKLKKEHSFIKEIHRFLKEKDYELMISELFDEKDLTKISNSYFRYKLSKKNVNYADIFLNRLFNFCDLKSDGLLEINEIGLMFSAIFPENITRNFMNLRKTWDFLSINQDFLIIEENTQEKIKQCDYENKGFVTYWDLFLREIQHCDLMKNCDFIG